MLKPFAILDTDFISKLYSTRNAADTPFLEKLFDFDYDFCCHEQILCELKKHDKSSINWLLSKSDKVKIYSDTAIIEMLKSFSLPESVACRYYISHLKSSCEIYEQNYFENCYGNLIDKIHSLPDFLRQIETGDDLIGTHHNLGEVKNTLLLKVLYLCTKNTVYKFCSDDQDTRSHILAYAAQNKYDLKCISPFSFFFLAKNELALSKEICDDYFSSWISQSSNQRVSVIERNGLKKTHLTAEVYSDIWNDSVDCTAEGYIKY